MQIGDKVVHDNNLCKVIEIDGALVRVEVLGSGQRYVIHRAFVIVLEK